ncbi:Teichoic acid translocation permease protein TagG [Legionella massiliensis]|uniref:Transport permease protein n=1 Tax=Legionella massiliensis TaxID=1034943 RepID=A0A078KTE4_9GAMM|nr:ABC transporter permease [Legionella massiliensis]CDZ76237.1 Teichoic acid translocation permease protein TagG [Legionella massiliensis]CEE11975.1 Teichoic acid translocation permease protein TagG [Legionella massiliensis]
MKDFAATPIEMIQSLWRNRGLILSLAKRDVQSRYRGSVLGLFWSFFQPILMLAVYTFVFSIIFNARWGNGSGSKMEFALILFAGLIVFNLFSECISRAPSLIISHTNYVKKVVFPLEILPWVSLCSALFQLVMNLSVWLLFYMLFFGMPLGTLIFLPMIILPVALIIMGLMWIFASLGVYLRDMGQMIGIIITVMMFLSPIFYPISIIPAEYQFLLNLNPLVPFIEGIRDVLYWGHIPAFVPYLNYFAFSFVFASLGFAWFQKTRKGFADVL